MNKGAKEKNKWTTFEVNISKLNYQLSHIALAGGNEWKAAGKQRAFGEKIFARFLESQVTKWLSLLINKGSVNDSY